MPYLSALEMCSRQGAIQIHVYRYLYFTKDSKLTYYLRKYKFLQINDFLGRLYWYLVKLKECPLGRKDDDDDDVQWFNVHLKAD